jgi:DNA-binding HxlR family transcriptional regulator
LQKYIPTFPLEALFHCFGRGWLISIMKMVEQKPRSFNELAKNLHEFSSVRTYKITSKILTERLKFLESNGYVIRKIVSTAPFRVSYDMTKTGQNTMSLFEEISHCLEKYPKVLQPLHQNRRDKLSFSKT